MSITPRSQFKGYPTRSLYSETEWGLKRLWLQWILSIHLVTSVDFVYIPCDFSGYCLHLVTSVDIVYTPCDFSECCLHTSWLQWILSTYLVTLVAIVYTPCDFSEYCLRTLWLQSHMPDDSYRRRFRSLLLRPLLYVWRQSSVVSSLCWFCTDWRKSAIWAIYRIPAAPNTECSRLNGRERWARNCSATVTYQNSHPVLLGDPLSSSWGE